MRCHMINDYDMNVGERERERHFVILYNSKYCNDKFSIFHLCSFRNFDGTGNVIKNRSSHKTELM